MNDDPLHSLQRTKNCGKAEAAGWVLLVMLVIIFFVLSNLPCNGMSAGAQQRISCQLLDAWEKRVAWLFVTLFMLLLNAFLGSRVAHDHGGTS